MLVPGLDVDESTLGIVKLANGVDNKAFGRAGLVVTAMKLDIEGGRENDAQRRLIRISP